MPRSSEHSTLRSRPSAISASGGGLLASAGVSTSTETEFYSPIPSGYEKGRHRYIVVLGTVMSGLGKGIFASSMAKLLKDKGLTVAPIKMEGYLNIDSGTLSPIRHGEVFVLDDGTECDLDLGTYERMLDQNLSHRNFVTAGQIYRDILDRERHGKYLGRDVQMIPHVTGEVKRKLRELAMYGDGETPADVVFVEVGGTVGDHENGFYIEALRQLAFEEGPGSVCFVALTYIIEPEALGEQKSKAAQLGVKKVMEAGIQPQLVACRATNPVESNVIEKIAMYTNVPIERVFSMHDRKSIDSIPEEMRKVGLDREILSLLDLHGRVNTAHEDGARARWHEYTTKLSAPKSRHIKIGLIGKYDLRDAYASVARAIEHSATALETSYEIEWIESAEISREHAAGRLGSLDGVIVPGGFGVRGVDGKIECVRYCREQGVPFLGICLGFQVAVIEYARSVLGVERADSTEFAQDEFPLAPEEVFISELPDQKKIEQLGGTMRLGGQDVVITPGTLAEHLFGAASVRERFRHRYEVEPDQIERLESAGLIFSGRHPEHPIMQVLELSRETHPYFIAAQFHPELTSRPLRPQPLFSGLLAAALAGRYPGYRSERWSRPEPAATG
ncbi:MAG: CTP synthase (glutamine hydrolyzing) [Planctomycetota bacterium]